MGDPKMNMHVDVAVAVKAADWKFQLEQWVTHTDQPLPSLVMWRGLAGDREIYGIRSFAEGDDNRDRLILGDKLKPVDEAAWAVCAAKDMFEPPYLAA